MNLNGQWWNPAYAGEGFYLTEQDGRLIGAFFTFDTNGNPTWFVFDCQRIGDTYAGSVKSVEGGGMASPLNPENATQEPAGTIVFVLNGGWSFEATINGSTFGYALQKLFPVDEAPPVEPPVPPVEPPTGIQGLKLEEYRANTWNEVDLPFTGQRVIHRPDYTGDNLTVAQFKISSDRDFTISEVSTNGIADARFEQIKVGDVVKPGEHIVCRCKAGNTGGERLYPQYRIATDEGDIVAFEVRLSTG